MKWWMFLVYLIANFGSIYVTLMFVSTLFDDFRWRVFSSGRHYYGLALFTVVVVSNTALIKFLQVLPWTFIMVNELAVIALLVAYVLLRFKTTWHVSLIVVSIYWVVSMMFEIPIALMINMYIPVEEFMSIEMQLVGTVYLTLCFLFAAGMVSMIRRKIHFRLEIPSSIISYVILTPIMLLVFYNVVFAKIFTSGQEGLMIYSFLLLIVCLIILMVYLWRYQSKKAS